MGTTGRTLGTGGCPAGVGRAIAADVSATAVAMPMIGETRIKLMQLFAFLFFTDGWAARFRVTRPICVTRVERRYGLRADGAWVAL